MQEGSAQTISALGCTKDITTVSHGTPGSGQLLHSCFCLGVGLGSFWGCFWVVMGVFLVGFWACFGVLFASLGGAHLLVCSVRKCSLPACCRLGRKMVVTGAVFRAHRGASWGRLVALLSPMGHRAAGNCFTPVFSGVGLGSFWGRFWVVRGSFGRFLGPFWGPFRVRGGLVCRRAR